jgi:hypothetical protein
VRLLDYLEKGTSFGADARRLTMDGKDPIMVTRSA